MSGDLRLATAKSDQFDASMAVEVAVVISSRNRAAFLPDLLAALSAQTYGRDRFEVVIVDDASTDDTWSVLESATRHTDMRLLVLRHGQQGGQGSGRNTGVENSQGSIVAFTDDDCVPDSGWLESLCAPLVAMGEGELAHRVIQGVTRPWPNDEASAGPWDRTIWVLGPTWLFETCNIAYRRADLVQAGGFPNADEAPVDPEGKLLGEDALLGWKATAAGAELVFVAEALVWHRHLPATFGDWVRGQRGRGVFPVMVRRNEMARRALWRRWFLAPRTAAFDAGLAAGLLWLLTRRARYLGGMLPWVWLALPEAVDRRGRHPIVRLGQLGIGDAVGFASLVRSSWREHRIVL